MRFSYFGQSGWQSDFSKDKEQLFATDRLEKRFFLFENIALASLAAQTNSNFKLFILTSADLPTWAMQRLHDLCQRALGLDRVAIKAHRPNLARKFLRIYLQSLGVDGPITQINLDDDDGLATDFIDTVSQRLHISSNENPVTSQPKFISFPRGYGLVFDEHGHPKELFLHSYRYINLGLTMTATAGGQNLFSIDHRNAPKRYGCEVVKERTMFVRSVHGLNDSRVTVTQRWQKIENWRSESEILERFPFMRLIQG